MAPNVALNTSKRKFYKLLDNLSSSRVNSSSTADSTRDAPPAAPGTEPANKRVRNERPFTAPSRPFSVGVDRPTSSVRAVGGTASTPRPVSEYEIPEGEMRPINYVPWDHERFLDRLKTFADGKMWTPKPSQLSEVEWAKRGWVVVAKDTVGCKGGCERRLLVSLTKEEKESAEEQREKVDADQKEMPISPADPEDELWWMDDVEKELINKYQALIVEGHDTDCLWRTQGGSKDDIYRIKMADPLVWQKELRERYLSLMTVASSLPDTWSISEEGATDPSPLDLDELIKCLPIDLLKLPPSPGEKAEKSNDSQPRADSAADAPDVEITTVAEREPPNHTALALAMCGWSAQQPHGVQLAYCTKCFQRIGLWLYHSTSPSSPSSTLTLETMTFNPIDLHREHCPWKNPQTQCSIGTLAGLSGWEVLVRLVKNGRRRFGVKEEKVKVESERVSWSDEDDETRKRRREETEKEDKARRSRIQKLKRVFSVKKKDKK
jgi:hypothetical protein